MTTFFSFRINPCRTAQEFSAIYKILSRYRELEHLIEWATRKKLSGPCRLYQSRLADEEQRLTRIAWRSPNVLSLARWLYCAIQLISPTPHYRAKGSASKYRSQRILEK